MTQTYTNQGGPQTQSGSLVHGRPNNSSVMMENFTWSNFRGTINQFNPGDGSCVSIVSSISYTILDKDGFSKLQQVQALILFSQPCWYNDGLPDVEPTEVVILECNTGTSCKNFRFEDIQVYPQGQTPGSQICFNATASLNPDLGISCHNGSFIPT